jgi:hypothetical protein
MGRETVTLPCGDGPCACPFSFAGKPPGPYEIRATAPGSTRGPEGTYTAFSLDRDRPGMRINLVPQASVRFNFRGPQSQTIDLSAVKLQVRRVDLAGESPAGNLSLNSGGTQLVQGRYQVQLVPNTTYVAMDFRGPIGERPDGGRADGWNEFTITGPATIAYVLSNKPAGLHGVVTTGAHDAIGGAPVFLEPWDPVTRSRLGDPHVVRTDMRGRYDLVGLAPGTYRLVSTFEYQSPDPSDVDTMAPRTIVIEEGRDQQQDLDLYVIR